MVTKEKIIAVTVMLLISYTISLSFVSQAFPAAQTSKTLTSSGSIQIQTSTGIEIYQDSGCTTSLSSVSWGTLVPGESQQYPIYVRNEGNTPITLSLDTSDWTPWSASQYLSLSWNYNNQEIGEDQMVPILLTLNVDSDISGIDNFSFEINIVAQ
jgi:hypothetical protein